MLLRGRFERCPRTLVCRWSRGSLRVKQSSKWRKNCRNFRPTFLICLTSMSILFINILFVRSYRLDSFNFLVLRQLLYRLSNEAANNCNYNHRILGEDLNLGSEAWGPPLSLLPLRRRSHSPGGLVSAGRRRRDEATGAEEARFYEFKRFRAEHFWAKSLYFLSLYCAVMLDNA